MPAAGDTVMVTELESRTITLWLQSWKAGDQDALGRVTESLYKDLRRLAAFYLKDERTAHTLAPTALVHEMYLQLGSLREIEWQDRAHFLAVAIRMMRRILIDHARRNRAQKRDPENMRPLAQDFKAAQIDVLAVDQALEKLAIEFPQHAKVVELRFFGGLDNSEVAEVLRISLRSVEREWRFARAWLQNRITSNLS